MKEFKKRHLTVLLVAVALFTLLTTVIRVICLLTYYESDVGYFARGFLPTAGTALLPIGLILFGALPIAFPKNAITAEKESPSLIHTLLRLPSVITLFVCGVSLLGNGTTNSIKLDTFAGITLFFATLFSLFSCMAQLPRFREQLSALTRGAT